MYTVARVCRTRMNHPHVRVNRLQAKTLWQPFIPRRGPAHRSGAKSRAGQGCVLWGAVTWGPAFHRSSRGDVALRQVAIDKLQRAQRTDCKLFVVGWQQAAWSMACLNAGGPSVFGHWVLLKVQRPTWSHLGHCYAQNIHMHAHAVKLWL